MFFPVGSGGSGSSSEGFVGPGSNLSKKHLCAKDAFYPGLKDYSRLITKFLHLKSIDVTNALIG
jgi:hypothetical protein